MNVRRAYAGAIAALAMFSWVGCGKTLTADHCRRWQQHAETLASTAKGKVSTCKPHKDDEDFFGRQSTIFLDGMRTACDGRAALPPPRDEQCFLAAKSTNEVRACNITVESALYRYANFAPSVDELADRVCMKK